MAAVKTIQGQKILVQLGDGAGSETFAAPCGLTEATIAFTASVQESQVHDCVDVDAPAWTERDVDGLSCTVSGNGLMDTVAVQTWWDWFESGDPKNCRIKVDTTLALGGGYYQGAFVLTSFQNTGARKQRATFEIEMQSHGAITWVDAAA